MLGRSFLFLVTAVYLVGLPGFAADSDADTNPKRSDKKERKKNKSEAAADSDQKTGEGAGDSQKDEPAKTGSKPPVLDPSRFFGAAMMGYAAAKAVPEVIDKLFCYCGCDITDKHFTLLDCFTSIHGVDCHICQEEAVLALKLHRSDTPMADIQKLIDEKYSDQYPFEEDSPTYKKYKAGRLYTVKGSIDTSSAEKKDGGQVSSTAAGPESPVDEKEKPWKPVLKPGKEQPKCCTGDDHKDSKATESPDSKGKAK